MKLIKNELFERLKLIIFLIAILFKVFLLFKSLIIIFNNFFYLY